MSTGIPSNAFVPSAPFGAFRSPPTPKARVKTKERHAGLLEQRQAYEDNVPSWHSSHHAVTTRLPTVGRLRHTIYFDKSFEHQVHDHLQASKPQ